MHYDFLAKENPGESHEVTVLIISGTCCNPSLGGLDERARRIIEAAAAETGIALRVEKITMTSAYYSAPADVKQKLMADFAEGGLNVPAVLIGGKAVSYGVPSIEVMKTALLDAADQMKGAKE